MLNRISGLYNINRIIIKLISALIYQPTVTVFASSRNSGEESTSSLGEDISYPHNSDESSRSSSIIHPFHFQCSWYPDDLNFLSDNMNMIIDDMGISKEELVDLSLSNELISMMMQMMAVTATLAIFFILCFSPLFSSNDEFTPSPSPLLSSASKKEYQHRRPKSSILLAKPRSQSPDPTHSFLLPVHSPSYSGSIVSLVANDKLSPAAGAGDMPSRSSSRNNHHSFDLSPTIPGSPFSLPRAEIALKRSHSFTSLSPPLLSNAQHSPLLHSGPASIPFHRTTSPDGSSSYWAAYNEKRTKARKSHQSTERKDFNSSNIPKLSPILTSRYSPPATATIEYDDSSSEDDDVDDLSPQLVVKYYSDEENDPNDGIASVVKASKSYSPLLSAMQHPSMTHSPTNITTSHTYRISPSFSSTINTVSPQSSPQTPISPPVLISRSNSPIKQID